MATYRRFNRIQLLMIWSAVLSTHTGCIYSVQVVGFKPQHIEQRDGNYILFELELDANLSRDFHSYNISLEYLVLDKNDPQIRSLELKWENEKIDSKIESCYSEIFNKNPGWHLKYLPIENEDGFRLALENFRGGFRCVTATEGKEAKYRVYLPRKSGNIDDSATHRYEIQQHGRYLILIRLAGRKVYSCASLSSNCIGVFFESR